MPLDMPYAVSPTQRVLRQAISPAKIDRLRGLNAWALGGLTPPASGQPQVRWEKSFRQMVGEGLIGHPKQFFDLFKGTEIEAVWHDVLGPDIAMCLTLTLVRDFNPTNRPVPARWHYDAFLLGHSTPMLNTWIPLNDVGRTAPGMTMSSVPHWPYDYWHREVEMTDANGLIPNARAEDAKYQKDEILALAENEDQSLLFDTVLEAGDVIVFDHQFIHGTQQNLAKSGRRRSIEVRVVPTAAALRLKHLGSNHVFLPVE